ncbi:sodium:calcium antiporter [Alkalilimnicola sp. S0819]|uniref:sodium:calcium antiporter n=1 Tax=Alkalilimnicola sp. S0819 TaxID=2613922 RepID=UPI001262202F|nr:sodium:calcium antiporter [Alkalilimnicola sp. S0819]KAB7627871.1 sodium:calcium antiporter [Alkalilimnicola sp. S0819]MPQ15507.1 sodium:calcium antiporter [Alkalilimnicola sp. S0819]
MWSLEVSWLALGLAVVCITAAGTRLVAIADEVADRTGAGEALIGATLLGAVTSLADITAVTSAAAQGYASLAVSTAVGGIAAQTAFLAVADVTLRRVNLEHAAASLPNLLSATVLLLILSLILVATLAPPMSLWSIHPVTPLLLLAYALGMRLVGAGHQQPMWQPRITHETRLDLRAENHPPRSGLSLALGLLSTGAVVAGSGWLLGESGQALIHHLGLAETAVGAMVVGVGTSLPELITSVAAVRRGALTLAVGGIIGGNTFDTLMVGVADVAYREGPIYQHVDAPDRTLIALTLFMTAVVLLGLLYRQRRGPGNIGLESVVILIAYALAMVLINLRY